MIQTRWYVNRSWEERKRNAKETRPRKRITEETRRPDTWCCIEIVSVVVNDLWNVEFITVQLTMLSDECSQVSSASCSFTEMIRSYCGQAWRSMVGPDVLRELSSIQWVCDGTFGVVTLCAKWLFCKCSKNVTSDLQARLRCSGQLPSCPGQPYFLGGTGLGALLLEAVDPRFLAS
jgi:hypothetical protein